MKKEQGYIFKTLNLSEVIGEITPYPKGHFTLVMFAKDREKFFKILKRINNYYLKGSEDDDERSKKAFLNPQQLSLYVVWFGRVDFLNEVEILKNALEFEFNIGLPLDFKRFKHSAVRKRKSIWIFFDQNVLPSQIAFVAFERFFDNYGSNTCRGILLKWWEYAWILPWVPDRLWTYRPSLKYTWAAWNGKGEPNLLSSYIVDAVGIAPESLPGLRKRGFKQLLKELSNPIAFILDTYLQFKAWLLSKVR